MSPSVRAALEAKWMNRMDIERNRQCFNCIYFDKGYCKILAMIRSPKSYHHCSYHRINKQKEKMK